MAMNASSDSEQFAFNCPRCGERLETEVAHAGHKVQCPYCEHKFFLTATQAPYAGGAGLARPPPRPRVYASTTRSAGLWRGAVAAALVAAALGFLLSRASRSPGPAAVPEPAGPGGLVHHWAFDEGPDWHDDPFGATGTAVVAADSVGTADAALRNMGATNWVSGRQFTALAFDGGDAFLETQADLTRTLGGTASLSFWIRTTQAGDGLPARAPALLGAAGARGVRWGWLDERGRIGIAVGEQPVVRSDEPVSDGAWHHVVLTRNATNGEGRVYVDGRPAGTSSGPPGLRPAPFAHIGRIAPPAVAVPFAGRLDQVHVYNRVIDTGTVAVLLGNHAPKAWDSLTAGPAGAPFTTECVFFRAYDPEQDPLAVARFAQPAHGRVAEGGEGTFVYTPAPGFSGEDAFAVTLTDGRGGYAAVRMGLRVEPPPPPGADKRTQTFADCAAIAAGGAPIALPGLRVPRAVDWDADGDADLLVAHAGAVWLFRNAGSRAAPRFEAGARVTAGGTELALAGGGGVAWVDLTGDGVPDLAVGDASGRVQVCRNTAPAGKPVALAAPAPLRDRTGGPLALADPRFDVADWNGDGLPDIVQGARAGPVRLLLNVGTVREPRFDPARAAVLEDGSYNLYPRVFDLNRTGKPDYIRGVNWGSIDTWYDPGAGQGLGQPGGALAIAGAEGAAWNTRAATDGAIVDFADFDGDGVYDVVIGGHAGDGIYLARGVRRSADDWLAEIESVYAAHPGGGLGEALEAGGQALLQRIRAAEEAFIGIMRTATRPEREAMFRALATHVRKYPFLQMAAPLDTQRYRHVPGIAGQNLMTLHQLLPDTPAHRRAVADAVGLAGLHRDIYLRFGLHVGDNQRGTRGQLESIRDLMARIPRPIFPDAMVTLDHYYGDGRGGSVDAFTGAKNTFNFGEGQNVSEWAADLNKAIEAFFGAPVQKGDYFTFVLGHEVTHSLDGYVQRLANRDLWRRKNLMLSVAAGPDVVAGADGGIDWKATRERFRGRGLWTGEGGAWEAAWKAYWESGPGQAWRGLSFMRGNIDWFLGAPQEALATQANHHHAHSEGRLIGALDRYRRGVESGVEPLKANLNEVVLFLDYQSAGLNKVVLYDTEGVREPYPHAAYRIEHAWLERDDAGFIRRATVGPRVYTFDRDARGVYTAGRLRKR